MVQDAGITPIPYRSVQYRNEYLLIKIKTFQNNQIKKKIEHETIKAKTFVTDMKSLKFSDFCFENDIFPLINA